LLFLLYINGLPKVVNDNAEVVLFADDTSIIINSLNPTNFTNSTYKILQDINKWFTTNLLSLNAHNTQYMEFVTAFKPFLSINSLKMNTVFKLQKRITRIMVGIRDRESCREYFIKLRILPLQSQYTYSLLLFVINNRQHYK
jgi:hypothetical protein